MASTLISDPLLYEINPTDNLPQLRVSARGEFVFQGLGTAILTTTLDVTDTATLLPATALTDRNGLTIHNTSTADILYLGNSDVEANRDLGTVAGLEVGPGQAVNIDITNAIVLYAIAETSKTIRVKITEVA